MDHQFKAVGLLAHKLTWKEAVQLVQIAMRSGNPIEECIAQVLNLRPQIITRHLFVGAVTNTQTRAWLHTIPQNQRDGFLSNALRKLTGPDYPTNVRLGVDEFTVLSDHALPTLLGLQPNDIEASINQTLAEAQE